jgi:hypothetical protein
MTYLAGLEAQVIELAPKEAIVWNERGMNVYEEPTELVDIVIDRLGFGAAERAALERQKLRFLGGETPPASRPLGRPYLHDKAHRESESECRHRRPSTCQHPQRRGDRCFRGSSDPAK